MLLNTPLCNFGWQAPDFELPDLEGNLHTLEGSMGENGLLVAFICNHCPYVVAIISRLVEDAKALKADGINTVAIMPNDFQSVSADSPEKMKRFAQKHDFGFPYLLDETQEVAKAYDALCTPDFFGLNTQAQLQYRGRLDDAKMQVATNRIPELLMAMRQVARTGNGPQDQQPSMGCSIKWR